MTACLSRDTFARVRDTDRNFAGYVGAVLRTARASSADLADAHVVASVVDAGGGVILTADDADMTRSAARYRNVRVVAI